MIDLHCHILPSLDDGARDLEDTLAMARVAAQDGIEAVCATPHLRHDHRVRVEEIAERVRTAQLALDAHEIHVRLLPGAEVAQTEAPRLSAAQLHAAALGGGGGGWLLLEPAPGPLADGLETLVQELAERDLRSIIAHPERHADASFRARLERLSELGCLIQWTAEFVTNAGTEAFVLELAREGLVHLLGSDAHSSHGGRPVRLAAAFARLARVLTPEQLEWTVQGAPEAVVRGAPVGPRP